MVLVLVLMAGPAATCYCELLVIQWATRLLELCGPSVRLHLLPPSHPLRGRETAVVLGCAVPEERGWEGSGWEGGGEEDVDGWGQMGRQAWRQAWLCEWCVKGCEGGAAGARGAWRETWLCEG